MTNYATTAHNPAVGGRQTPKNGTTTGTHNHQKRETDKMTRNMRSAKAAGSSFERLTADYLADALNNDAIDRKVKTGAHDQGDIANVKAHGQRVAVECKNTAKISLSGWAAEAEAERINLDALAGVVVHKRHGKGRAPDQWVTMTLADFAALLSGVRRETPGK